MEKLTFKQYLASKEKLREAIASTPVRKARYSLRKYCKFPVGESKEEKNFISLKPKHEMVVEWLYTNPDNPTAVSLTFENVDGVNAEEEFVAFWSDERFQKWLLKNTRELQE